MSSRFVVGQQSVISGDKPPSAFGVVTVVIICSSSAANVIPEDGKVTDTIRRHNKDVRAKILDGIARTAKGIAVIAGAQKPKIRIDLGARAVFNDPSATERTAKLLTAAFGEKVKLFPLMSGGGEDYSEFVEAGVLSFYFAIGDVV